MESLPSNTAANALLSPSAHDDDCSKQDETPTASNTTSRASSLIENRRKPRISLYLLSSLDSIIQYREEMSRWKQKLSDLPSVHSVATTKKKHCATDSNNLIKSCEWIADTQSKKDTQAGFRHWLAEIGFCFTVAMTQLLTEYLISGFAVELPTLLSSYVGADSSSLGIFWPASLLSLALSASLLIFARLTDLYGGYPCFMFGTTWLLIWTLIPGFFRTSIMLDISRAMQGLAIAAFTPSAFAMIGSVYPIGPRRNLIIGLYSGCAPIGFFSGILTASVLDGSQTQWYFWTASILTFVTIVTGYLSVPCDRVDRKNLNISMDWLGAFFITAGLILVTYAIALEPYATCPSQHRSGFTCASVLAPFICGFACLAAAVWIEGWFAKCSLIPFDFFEPKSMVAFSFAALCFYATFGVWLYTSVDLFQSPTGATHAADGVHGLQLAIWYLPFVIGGLILCVVSGSLLHGVPIMVMLMISALAWVGAPLLLAVSSLPLNYWSSVFPSMICGTIGIDVTFTISIIFFSSVQPIQYQGLAGAVCSILINLAISFALPISEIVSKQATESMTPGRTPADLAEAKAAQLQGYRSALFYATASAGCGMIICALFVRISSSIAQGVQEAGGGNTTEEC